MNSKRHEQAMEILLAAVDLKDQERSAYLDRVCEADDELRAEVESLLGYHQKDTAAAAATGATVRAPGRPLGERLEPSRVRKLRTPQWIKDPVVWLIALLVVPLGKCILFF